MIIGVGAVLHLSGGTVVFMAATTEVITGITTPGDGIATVMDMAGTTGAGEATDGAVITALITILLIDITHITIPVVGLEITTITEIMPIAPAGEGFTIPIPT